LPVWEPNSHSQRDDEGKALLGWVVSKLWLRRSL